MHLHPSCHRSNPASSRDRGSVTVIVIAAVTGLAVLMMAMLSATVDTSRWTKTEYDVKRAASAAEGATTLAANQIWSAFEVSLGGNSPRIGDFQAFLDSRGIVDSATVANSLPQDLKDLVGLPTNPAGNSHVDGVEIDRLEVERVDDVNSTRLLVTAVASARLGDTAGKNHAISESVQQAFVIEPPDWEGLSYAMLANNINCVMCHTRIDSAERFYNTDETRYGTFGRVKLGSLESIHLRSDPESSFAGTLYLGGRALGDHGAAISDWSSLNFNSQEFGADGKIVEDEWGDTIATNLSPADSATPVAGENLYLDYTAGGVERMVDGVLPSTFPSPFPDDGGYDPITHAKTPEFGSNRILDYNEFMMAVGKSNGAVSGGTIGTSPSGTSIATGAQLAALTSGNAAALDSITSGNVYLHGTEANPIRLSGDIAIHGDLILSGFIEGRGSLSVSGNVYIPSDLVYADGSTDGNRNFGTNVDGASNTVSLASGGNVVVGDPYHPAWGSGDPANGQADGSFNFLMEEMAIFNRMEWMKTQPTLPGEPEQVVTRTETWDDTIVETELVTWDVEEDVYTNVVVGTREVPVFSNVVVGTREEPVYSNVVVGSRDEPVFTWVVVEDRPAEYGGPIRERQQTGTRTVDVTERRQTGTRTVNVRERQQTGTRTENVTERQLTGTRTVTRSEQRPTGVTSIVPRSRDIVEWVTPQLPNPSYLGAAFIPRYYSFSAGTPVTAFNKEGHFNGELWISEERAGGWDEDKLTIADPTDTSDSMLYHADGSPKAVISTITPSNGWLSNELLRGLIQGKQAARDDSTALEVDATIYSSNSIFGIIPNREAPGMNGKLLVNGALVAADVGLLAPRGTQLNYDARGRKLLRIRSDTRLGIRRQLWAPVRAD